MATFSSTMSDPVLARIGEMLPPTDVSALALTNKSTAQLFSRDSVWLQLASSWSDCAWLVPVLTHEFPTTAAVAPRRLAAMVMLFKSWMRLVDICLESPEAPVERSLPHLQRARDTARGEHGCQAALMTVLHSVWQVYRDQMSKRPSEVWEPLRCLPWLMARWHMAALYCGTREHLARIKRWNTPGDDGKLDLSAYTDPARTQQVQQREMSQLFWGALAFVRGTTHTSATLVEVDLKGSGHFYATLCYCAATAPPALLQLLRHTYPSGRCAVRHAVARVLADLAAYDADTAGYELLFRHDWPSYAFEVVEPSPDDAASLTTWGAEDFDDPGLFARDLRLGITAVSMLTAQWLRSVERERTHIGLMRCLCRLLRRHVKTLLRDAWWCNIASIVGMPELRDCASHDAGSEAMTAIRDRAIAALGKLPLDLAEAIAMGSAMLVDGEFHRLKEDAPRRRHRRAQSPAIGPDSGEELEESLSLSGDGAPPASASVASPGRVPQEVDADDSMSDVGSQLEDADGDQPKAGYATWDASAANSSSLFLRIVAAQVMSKLKRLVVPLDTAPGYVPAPRVAGLPVGATYHMRHDTIRDALQLAQKHVGFAGRFADACAHHDFEFAQYGGEGAEKRRSRVLLLWHQVQRLHRIDFGVGGCCHAVFDARLHASLGFAFWVATAHSPRLSVLDESASDPLEQTFQRTRLLPRSAIWQSNGMSGIVGIAMHAYARRVASGEMPIMTELEPLVTSADAIDMFGFCALDANGSAQHREVRYQDDRYVIPPKSSATPSVIHAAAQLWRAYMDYLDPNTPPELLQRFLTQLSPLIMNAPQAMSAAVLLSDLIPRALRVSTAAHLHRCTAVHELVESMLRGITDAFPFLYGVLARPTEFITQSLACMQARMEAAMARTPVSAALFLPDDLLQLKADAALTYSASDATQHSLRRLVTLLQDEPVAEADPARAFTVQVSLNPVPPANVGEPDVTPPVPADAPLDEAVVRNPANALLFLPVAQNSSLFTSTISLGVSALEVALQASEQVTLPSIRGALSSVLAPPPITVEDAVVADTASAKLRFAAMQEYLSGAVDSSSECKFPYVAARRIPRGQQSGKAVPCTVAGDELMRARTALLGPLAAGECASKLRLTALDVRRFGTFNHTAMLFSSRSFEVCLALAMGDWRVHAELPASLISNRLTTFLAATVLGGYRQRDFTWAPQVTVEPHIRDGTDTFYLSDHVTVPAVCFIPRIGGWTEVARLLGMPLSEFWRNNLDGLDRCRQYIEYLVPIGCHSVTEVDAMATAAEQQREQQRPHGGRHRPDGDDDESDSESSDSSRSNSDHHRPAGGATQVAPRPVISARPRSYVLQARVRSVSTIDEPAPSSTSLGTPSTAEVGSSPVRRSRVAFDPVFTRPSEGGGSAAVPAAHAAIPPAAPSVRTVPAPLGSTTAAATNTSTDTAALASELGSMTLAPSAAGSHDDKSDSHDEDSSHSGNEDRGSSETDSESDPNGSSSDSHGARQASTLRDARRQGAPAAGSRTLGGRAVGSDLFTGEHNSFSRPYNVESDDDSEEHGSDDEDYDDDDGDGYGDEDDEEDDDDEDDDGDEDEDSDDDEEDDDGDNDDHQGHGEDDVDVPPENRDVAGAVEHMADAALHHDEDRADEAASEPEYDLDPDVLGAPVDSIDMLKEAGDMLGRVLTLAAELRKWPSPAEDETTRGPALPAAPFSEFLATFANTETRLKPVMVWLVTLLARCDVSANPCLIRDEIMFRGLSDELEMLMARSSASSASRANPDDDDGAAYDDLLFSTLLPDMATTCWQLVGTILRDCPVPVVEACIDHVGLMTLARVLVCTMNFSVVHQGEIHNYFFALGEALSGRIPRLVLAICALVDASPGIRDAWLASFKVHLIPHLGDSTYLQGSLALTLLLQQLCVYRQGVVVDSMHPRSLLGVETMVNTFDARSAPSPLQDGVHVRVPQWLMEPPSKWWLKVDLGSLRPHQPSFTRFRTRTEAASCMLSELLAFVSTGFLSPVAYEVVAASEIVDLEWQMLCTSWCRSARWFTGIQQGNSALLRKPLSAARLADVKKDLPMSTHVVLALLRSGGLLEAMRLGWTAAVPIDRLRTAAATTTGAPVPDYPREVAAALWDCAREARDALASRDILMDAMPALQAALSGRPYLACLQQVATAMHRNTTEAWNAAAEALLLDGVMIHVLEECGLTMPPAVPPVAQTPCLLTRILRESIHLSRAEQARYGDVTEGLRGATSAREKLIENVMKELEAEGTRPAVSAIVTRLMTTTIPDGPATNDTMRMGVQLRASLSLRRGALTSAIPRGQQFATTVRSIMRALEQRTLPWDAKPWVAAGAAMKMALCLWLEGASPPAMRCSALPGRRFPALAHKALAPQTEEEAGADGIPEPRVPPLSALLWDRVNPLLALSMVDAQPRNGVGTPTERTSAEMVGAARLWLSHMLLLLRALCV